MTVTAKEIATLRGLTAALDADDPDRIESAVRDVLAAAPSSIVHGDVGGVFKALGRYARRVRVVIQFATAAVSAPRGNDDSRLADIEAVIQEAIGLQPGRYTPTALLHMIYATRRNEREAGLAIYAAKLREVEEAIERHRTAPPYRDDFDHIEDGIAGQARSAALDEIDRACAEVWCCAEYRASSDGTEQHSDECDAALCDIDCATRRSTPDERLPCDCGWGPDGRSSLVDPRLP